MPYEIGDTQPPHITVHNELNAQVAELSTRTGIEVVLPPIVSLGDDGHVNDHNLYTVAIQQIAAGITPDFSYAEVVGTPTKVSGDNEVQPFAVRNMSGTRQIIYALLGNTGTNAVPTVVNGIEVMSYRQEPAVFEATLTVGLLPGVMVASGGPGGYSNATYYAGAGGAGGVVGAGCHMPVVLTQTDTATYRFTVGSTSVSDNQNHIVMYGQSTTIAAQGEEPFMAAVGGGGGFTVRNSQFVQPYNGGSGGGGMAQNPSDEPLNDNFGRPGDGVPGQGHPGGVCQNPFGGGGGGYGGPGNVGLYSGGPFNVAGAAGGPGLDLVALFDLDPNDSGTKTFLSACTADGMIAGGGSTNSTSVDGGGALGEHGKDWTGGGGGGNQASGMGANGGAGAVYLIGPA